MPSGETTAGDLGRLRWRCRRGMKELDSLLTAYLDRHFESASAREQRDFRELLELQDPELHDYCLGRQRPASVDLAALIDRIVNVHPVT